MTADPVYCERRIEGIKELTSQAELQDNALGEGIGALSTALADQTMFGIIRFALNPRAAAMTLLLQAATGFTGMSLLYIVPIIQQLLSLLERFSLERRSVKRRLKACRESMKDVHTSLEGVRRAATETQDLTHEARRLANLADATGRSA